ncbi:MAG: hypothetical protein ACTMKW_02005 [Brevibacterium aurantiacum]
METIVAALGIIIAISCLILMAVSLLIEAKRPGSTLALLIVSLLGFWLGVAAAVYAAI